VIWLYCTVSSSFCQPNPHPRSSHSSYLHVIQRSAASRPRPRPRLQQLAHSRASQEFPPPTRSCPSVLSTAHPTQDRTQSSNTNCVSAQGRVGKSSIPIEAPTHLHLLPTIDSSCCTEYLAQSFAPNAPRACAALRSLSPSIELPSDCDYTHHHLSNLPLAWAWWGLR
jgi:hypothetical protein